MSKLGRIGNVLLGLLLLVLAAAMVFVLPTDEAVLAMVVLLAVSLALYGVRTIWLYISLARHMVGGKALLYVGVLALDAALVVSAVLSNQFLTGLYLSISYFVTGAANVMHASDDKRYGTPAQGHMAHAVIYVLLGILCLVLSGNADLLVLVYCVGLIYSALMRIYSAIWPRVVAYIP